MGVILDSGFKNLLFEIGTEELPSVCLNEGISGLNSLLKEKLKEQRIGFSNIYTLATPRRLVAFVNKVSKKQQKKEKIITGPTKKIAFTKQGEPTRAAIGFAKSQNVDVEDLQEIKKGRGIFMGIKLMEQSRPTEQILPGLLKDVVLSIPFSMQMTWGNYDIKFARPIRWLVAIYGQKIIKFNIENIYASNITFGMRSGSKQKIRISEIKNLPDYLFLLEKKANVILDPLRRKKMILDAIKKIEGKEWNNSLKAVVDEGLLDEVVNLVEYPNVLVGSFPGKYLFTSTEILIKAIQHHQRYFAVVNKDGTVAPRFLVVQNGIEDKRGEVISGNERVLKARLSDARFFYKEDMKHDFDFWYKKLQGVIFYTGLGTLYDKSQRVKNNCIKIENSICKKESSGPGIVDRLSRASTICKCDLVTNLVVEFPELQGLVGREYAIQKGEDNDVADALFEHYLPRFANDILPETYTGSILSIADKFDTLAGMFITGNIPSGSQDPFALRRKAAGIISIALKGSFNIDILKISEFALKQYLEKFDFKDIDIKDITRRITDFIIARYRFRLEKKDKRIDIFDSIVSSGCYSVTEIDLRYKSIEEYSIKKDIIKNIAEPFIRCINITKGKNKFSSIKEEHLIEDSEKDLLSQVSKKRKTLKNLLASKEYKPALLELEEFAYYINKFFDDVLVMDKNDKLKENRLAIVKKCAELYLLIADFSRIK